MLKTNYAVDYYKAGDEFFATTPILEGQILSAKSFTKLKSWVLACLAEELECEADSINIELRDITNLKI